jgi:hypothetical protein
VEDVGTAHEYVALIVERNKLVLVHKVRSFLLFRARRLRQLGFLHSRHNVSVSVNLDAPVVECLQLALLIAEWHQALVFLARCHRSCPERCCDERVFPAEW